MTPAKSGGKLFCSVCSRTVSFQSLNSAQALLSLILQSFFRGMGFFYAGVEMDCPHGLRAYVFPPPTRPSASLPAQSVQAISVAGKPVDVWRHCPLCTWVTCKSGADNKLMTRQSRKQPALDCWSAHKLARRTTNILKDKKNKTTALFLECLF